MSRPLTDALFGFQSSTRTSETGGADDQSKEDEDDDGDEEDEKITGHNYDPERLKSFNVNMMNIGKTSKLSITGPLRGESGGDQRIPVTKGQYGECISMS